MNLVVIHGRLANEPDVKTTATGKAYAKFTVAVDRYVKAGEQKSADFISCVAWSKSAEFVGKYFHKGKEILLEGHIQTGRYEKDGRKVYTTDVIVDRLEFCGSKDEYTPRTPDNSDVPF